MLLSSSGTPDMGSRSTGRVVRPAQPLVVVKTASKNEFASAWLLLFSSVLIFVVPAAVMSVVAVLTSLRSPESRERRWHHAGANPRIFIPDIPEESELGS